MPCPERKDSCLRALNADGKRSLTEKIQQSFLEATFEKWVSKAVPKQLMRKVGSTY